MSLRGPKAHPNRRDVPLIPLRSSARFAHSSLIMARFARVVAIDAPHHITQRGNARQTVFEGDPDRLVYLGLLRQHSTIPAGCLRSSNIGHRSARPTRKDVLGEPCL
jgi:hypothetical protein